MSKLFLITNIFTFILLIALTQGCETVAKAPLKTVDAVEIPKFMGKWYVIANIPTFIEKGAHNATETYTLRDDGDIDVSFHFNKDAFDGPAKEYHPKGFIHDKHSNAEWRMRFIWPFLADYLILDLADDYTYTIIGVPSRKYIWIMAREPKISDTLYTKLVQKIKAMDFDVSQIKKVPQKY